MLTAGTRIIFHTFKGGQPVTRAGEVRVSQFESDAGYWEVGIVLDDDPHGFIWTHISAVTIDTEEKNS